MEMLRNLSYYNAGDNSEKEEEERDPKKGTQLLLFVWSIENFLVSKVNLNEPLDNDNFDALNRRKFQRKRMARQGRKFAPIESVAKQQPKGLVAKRQLRHLAK